MSNKGKAEQTLQSSLVRQSPAYRSAIEVEEQADW